MKPIKRVERFGKQCIRSVLGSFLKPVPLENKDIQPETINRILVVRQDSRLGNLVLMSPLLSAIKAAMPHAELDVLISEGFEEVLTGNPNVDNVILFEKKRARLMPWRYLFLISKLRKNEYDMAIDVSDGYHFSLNNILLTAFSGAHYRLGYERGDAKSFLNILVPLPPKNTHMSDAILGLAEKISPIVGKYPMKYYLSDEDRVFAGKWLIEHDIHDIDSFFAIHPGGKGRKKWGAENFAALIDKINDAVGVKIVVLGGKAEKETIEKIKKHSKTRFDILDNVRVGEMAAVIERCDMFISGDTGPMHVSSALDRPTVALFSSSNYSVYGPRGMNSRIVVNKEGNFSFDDIMLAIMGLYGIEPDKK
ncbi:glycosyltransferase family 9 protein [Candidatus Latescibacterota bacterium]